MKTSELTGAQLDFWAAKADGIESAWIALEEGERPRCILGPAVMDRFEWAPSDAWEQGGPIIEREKIQLMPWKPELAHQASWTAIALDKSKADGRTALEAAMRAFVISKFGEEVPKEIGRKVHRG